MTAKDLATLCANATKVRDATKKTCARVLVQKVEDYLYARHKVQERIKAAIAETSSSMISLTREVSADLYRIVGVIVSAIVGAFLKPDLSAWAFLSASLVILVYLGLVILFYLWTLRRTYRLRMDQHTEYIRSFQDLLRTAEIDELLGDEHLGRAQAMFAAKCNQVTAIYASLQLLALAIAVASVFGLLGKLSVSPFASLLSGP